MSVFWSKTIIIMVGMQAGLGIMSGQTPDPSGDKAKECVDLAYKAMGGENYRSMRTLMSAGRIYSFFRDQTSGADVAKIYTEYLPELPKEGVALRERQYLGKKMDYSNLFLENQGWELTFRGARPIARDIIDRYQRTTRNDILYFLKYRRSEPGLYYDFIGSEVYLSRHVEIVEISDAERQTIRVYFDHNTHLPIRETFSWLDPDTRYRNDVVLEYDKFRDVGGGIMWPFNIERSRNGYKTYQMFATTVEANVNPPQNAFALPDKAKILEMK